MWGWDAIGARICLYEWLDVGGAGGFRLARFRAAGHVRSVAYRHDDGSCINKHKSISSDLSYEAQE